MALHCTNKKPAPIGSPFPAPRCGRCSGCLSHKRWRWKARVLCEMGAPRTWFGTLTYAGNKPDYSNVQKWFKRLRKSGIVFRYMCVTERGSERDRLHWHVLLHCDVTVTYRKLHQSWRRSDGLSDFRLVRTRTNAAEYATKCASYVVKQDGRIRCSSGYGSRGYLSNLIERKTDDKKDTGSLIAAVFETFGDARITGARVGGVVVPKSVLRTVNANIDELLSSRGVQRASAAILAPPCTCPACSVSGARAHSSSSTREEAVDYSLPPARSAGKPCGGGEAPDAAGGVPHG